MTVAVWFAMEGTERTFSEVVRTDMIGGIRVSPKICRWVVLSNRELKCKIYLHSINFEYRSKYELGIWRHKVSASSNVKDRSNDSLSCWAWTNSELN